MKSKTILWFLLAALLVVAACSTGGGATTTGATDLTTATTGGTDLTTATTAGTAGTTAAPATTAAAGGEAVSIATSDLGDHLVAPDGFTLYIFTPDAQGDPTCVDACAENWLALVGPVTAGDGVDAALLGTATRPDDGTVQATYNGWPLYYYAGDPAVGDTNGQGLFDSWWVIDGAGEPISS